MFSNRIAGSAKFLQMSVESQLLYFHLVVRADDDGVVETYPIMKMLGTAPDAYKLLIARGYVTPINEDQVVIIEDWLEHNVIRADRKVDSIYKKLLPETAKVIEAKPRSDVEDNSRRVGGLSTDGISQVRLGKVKLGKETSHRADGAEVVKAFEGINPAAKLFYANTTQRKACDELIESHGLERVVEVVTETLPKSNRVAYLPTITSPVQLRDKWAQLESGLLKLKDKSRTTKPFQVV